ncbi:MAG: type II toxin-antitoxin system RelE/ParE family toxin [Dongiaceae bacterium]
MHIWLDIARDDPKAADRMFDRLESRCSELAAHPRLGRTRPDIAVGARCLVVEPYLILYRILGGDVEIVRVVHGARNLPRRD